MTINLLTLEIISSSAAWRKVSVAITFRELAFELTTAILQHRGRRQDSGAVGVAGYPLAIAAGRLNACTTLHTGRLTMIVLLGILDACNR